MTATEQYIERLASLEAGALGLLRTHSGQGLDHTVDGFDLFAGLWWPLRQKNQRTPRREVAWLIAKLYAFQPLAQSSGAALTRQLRRCQPSDDRQRKRFSQRLDDTLTLPLHEIESSLQWALRQLSAKSLPLDWVGLTDDLSDWERESIRLKWAEEFLNA